MALTKRLLGDQVGQLFGPAEVEEHRLVGGHDLLRREFEITVRLGFRPLLHPAIMPPRQGAGAGRDGARLRSDRACDADKSSSRDAVGGESLGANRAQTSAFRGTLKVSASSVDKRFMRQCPTCRRIYPKALGSGAHCSVDCEQSHLRRIRSAVRLRRLARIVKAA